ncbi:MAG: hypothetical protein Q8L60_00745 [Gammaproteobacteria bacterium]|nr:hypothetical protein [Gammaproteobacteria bacterium]MDP2142016.1 hypothetical protein [Gammaproteobacteria bacterium]MDP2348405.1 hypothetical protein [Gammaproteobacteria bacterium]
MKRISMGSIIVAAALFLSACASSTPPNPFVGLWDVSIDTPVGSMAAVLDIEQDLSGIMSSNDLGSTPLNNVSVTDNAVTFAATVDAQGQTLTLRFAGTIAGNRLAGNFDTDFGPIPLTGTKR